MPHWIRAGARVAILGVLALLSACAKYHPLPLDRVPASDRLRDTPDDVIRAKAADIQHPVLRPLTIDFGDGLSPDEAALIAVVANPRLAAIRDGRRLAAAQLLQAGILPNPQLSANLDLPAGGNTAGTVNAFGLGLDYGVRALLQRAALIEAAKRQAESVDLDVAWQEWQVAQAAKLQVYLVGFLETQLEIARGEEDAFQRSVDLVEKALAAGYTTIVEMSSARAALQRAQALRLAVEQQLALEKLALNRALGINPDRQVRPQSGIEPPNLARLPGLAAMVRDLESHRLDLMAFRLAYQSQEARLRASVRGRFPPISLSLASARDTGNVFTTGPAVSIGLPFFDRNQGPIAIEQATRQQLFDEYTSRLFEARATLARILASAESLQAQIRAGEQGIASLNEVVQTYRAAMLRGNADILVYYNARNELMAKQLDVVRLKQDLASLGVALEIAAGQTLSSLRTEEPRP